MVPYYQSSEIENPKGPADSYDPDEPNTVKRVVRGGSFYAVTNTVFATKQAAEIKAKLKVHPIIWGFVV
jgi:hypothetical protein